MIGFYLWHIIIVSLFITKIYTSPSNITRRPGLDEIFVRSIFKEYLCKLHTIHPKSKHPRVVLFSHCQNLVPSESEDVNDFSQIQGGFYPRELILSGIPCNQCSDGFSASISEQANNSQHLSPPDRTLVLESEVEVEGRRSSSLPRDPNARTVAWSYQVLLVCLEWKCLLEKAYTGYCTFLPLIMVEFKMSPLKGKNKLSWRHTKCTSTKPKRKKSLPSHTE